MVPPFHSAMYIRSCIHRVFCRCIYKIYICMPNKMRMRYRIRATVEWIWANPIKSHRTPNPRTKRADCSVPRIRGFSHFEWIRFAVQKRPYVAQKRPEQKRLILHKRGCTLHKRDLRLHMRDSLNCRADTMIGCRPDTNPVTLHTSWPKAQTALFTESECSGNLTPLYYSLIDTFQF